MGERGTRRIGLGAALGAAALLVAAVGFAQPEGWARAGLRENQLLRFQHFTAPYEGWYCVRVVQDDGRIRGWRQEGGGRTHVVRGQLSIVGLGELTAGLALIPPGPPPPPQTAPGDTRMRLIFRTPAGVQRREYAGRIPGPVRAVVNLVEAAIGADSACRL